jgi:hypothetical protein
LGLLGVTNHWSFGGSFVNESNQACATCSINWTNDPSLLTNETTVAYWVSGGRTLPGATYQAELKLGLFFTNGQIAKLEERGLFAMLRPLPDFTARTQAVVAVDADYYVWRSTNRAGPTFLHFGNARSFAEDGIAFAYTNAPIKAGTNTYGTYSLVQVIDSFIQRYNVYTDSNGVCVAGFETNIVSARDGDGTIGSLSLGDHSPTDWSDSPCTPLGVAGWLWDSRAFHSWLMFQPEPPSICVPMYDVQWSWYGSATNYPWGKRSGSATCGSPQLTESFPEYKQVISIGDIDTSPKYMSPTNCFNEN